MMEKEAMEYLIDLGEERNDIREVNGFSYSIERLHLVKEPKADVIVTSSLSSLVDYINSNHSDLEKEELIIHVESPTRVSLYGALDFNREREKFMECQAITPNNIRYNNFLNTEEFNIMLQASFVDNKDKSLLLKVTGCIKEDTVKEVGDDGVSQGVTIKTGVASVNTVEVPNPVILAPYRSFQEIEQVESKFIFRMQSGPRAALFEADGGMWRNEAIDKIKKYLRENIKEIRILG